jgi:hypothetical protein
VKYQTNKAKDGRNKIELASFWLPLAGLIVGVLALAGGILLLVSGRKQAPPSEVPPPPPYPGQPAPPNYAAPPAGPDIAPPPPPDTEVTQPLPR